jgi:mRNA interferase MazF
VPLARGEGGLPEASVVDVSQLLTVDKEELTEFIGQLSRRRIDEIVAGVIQLVAPIER